ncbi:MULTISPECIES: DUF4169 family protein [Rhizobium]|uniref:DUF4169 family protein n=1 Tax=Rhizobium rhododendri TaxID=2506430 RepID=A0ABY8IMA4_9HYPH|nr:MULTISPECIES: DUF4169 family protein [Rhizobium]MBO9098837.1 DUF4169 family protein [Rhizobium sp. L58/93]MBO9169103.1 DUF4169 family protein [Rhizobium sp. L245/93]MBO9185053.1 DUF4169 family protein [Rhizobium sp. E27B/91]MBZ5758472.1 DUF4169 family protein [Rhizobium sp. VS19-DR96]MBZ5764698.1 DUF4169 family protein [Rhizobium sp. VS19-DR129.2]
MTAEIVNLKQFRKQQARSDKEKQAEQNRITFGRTKSEKKLTTTLNDKASKALDDGHIEQPSTDK